MSTRVDAEHTRWRADRQQWHAERNAALADPQGWLGLMALHWLTEQPVALAGIPGRWRVVADTVVHQHESGDTAVYSPREGAPGERVCIGGRSAEIIRRTAKLAVRIHDSQAPHIAAFTVAATCPIAPAENRLPVEVAAGEQDPKALP